jgi:hypothetical protein
MKAHAKNEAEMIGHVTLGDFTTFPGFVNVIDSNKNYNFTH